MERKDWCKHLRCKQMYYTSGDAEPQMDHRTTIYWCLRTFKPIGPDANPCTQEDCKPDRSCFEQE